VHHLGEIASVASVAKIVLALLEGILCESHQDSQVVRDVVLRLGTLPQT